MQRGLFTAILLMPLVLAACTRDNPAFEAPAPVCDEGEVFSGQRFTLPAQQRLDFVVILDTSDDYALLHEAFAEQFTEELAELDERGVDWQVGVTTADMIDRERRGQLQSFREAEGCESLSDDPLVRSAERNALERVRCHLRPREIGSPVSEPLAAARQASFLALQAPESANRGMLRDGATPVYILLSASSDCSGSSSARAAGSCDPSPDDLVPVEDYARFLFRDVPDSRLSDVATPVFVALTGPSGEDASIRCRNGVEVGSATRVAEVARAARDRGFRESLCSTSFRPLMADAIDLALSQTRICLARELARAPVDVVKAPDSEEPETLEPFGDWIALPPGEGCYFGGIDLNADRLEREQVELRIRYCRVADQD